MYQDQHSRGGVGCSNQQVLCICPLRNHPLHHHAIWIWDTSRSLLWFALLATLQLALIPFSLGTIGTSADLETCSLHIRIAEGITLFSLALQVTVYGCNLKIVLVRHWIPIKGLHELVWGLAPPPHTHMLLTHCRNHSVEEVTHFTSAGSDCCGDDNMGWYPFHEVVEGEEYITIEISRFYR